MTGVEGWEKRDEANQPIMEGFLVTEREEIKGEDDLVEETDLRKEEIGELFPLKRGWIEMEDTWTK